MLEYFHETKEGSAVGRKRMGNLPALICFIHQARLHKRLGMLGDGFKIRIERCGDLLDGNPFARCHCT